MLKYQSINLERSKNHYFSVQDIDNEIFNI